MTVFFSLSHLYYITKAAKNVLSQTRFHGYWKFLAFLHCLSITTLREARVQTASFPVFIKFLICKQSSSGVRGNVEKTMMDLSELSPSTDAGYNSFGQSSSALPALSWTRVTACGRMRRFSDVACREWIYLVVGMLATAVAFALTVERLLMGHPRGSDNYIFVWVSSSSCDLVWLSLVMTTHDACS
jgi:hypothetical protein